jgi:hypothetical protein
MSVIEHKRWQIESRSYRTAANRWCPRALVSLSERGRFCTHDVRALLSLTFENVRDADEFAIKMAKTWIEDKEYRPRWESSPRRLARRLDAHDLADQVNHEAGAKPRMTKDGAYAVGYFTGRLPLLPRLKRLLPFGAEPSRRQARSPALARPVDRRRHG